jgi:DNA polymerase-3 subunit epsilon
MKFDKPIICLDIETTGLDIGTDKIIEIYLLKKNIDGTLEEWYSRFNPYPTIISEGAFSKHGITQEDLENEPLIKEKIPEILKFIEGCDLLGYNLLKFDIPMIIDEFIRNGFVFNHKNHFIYDAYRIWTHFEKRTLGDAVNRFLGRDITNYHTAHGDVVHTLEIFEKQIQLFGDGNMYTSFDPLFEDNVKKIDFNGTFQLNEKLDIVFGGGKHQGKLVKDIVKSERGYMDWLIEKSSMPIETKLIAKKLLAKFA